MCSSYTNQRLVSRKVCSFTDWICDLTNQQTFSRLPFSFTRKISCFKHSKRWPNIFVKTNFRKKTVLYPDPGDEQILAHPNQIPEVTHVNFFVTNIFQMDLSQPILSQIFL